MGRKLHPRKAYSVFRRSGAIFCLCFQSVRNAQPGLPSWFVLRLFLSFRICAEDSAEQLCCASGFLRVFDSALAFSALWIVRVGFYFQDLLGVAFAVRGNEQDELIAVELHVHGAVYGVVTQSGGGSEELLGGRATFEEMFKGTVGRAEAISRDKRLRSLGFLRAVRNHSQYRVVGLLEIATGDSRRSHYFFRDHSANVIFGGGDVLHYLRDGPAIRSRLEIPLGLREALGGLEDTLPGLLQVLNGALLFCWSDFLRSGRGLARAREYGDSRCCPQLLNHAFARFPLYWLKKGNGWNRHGKLAGPLGGCRRSKMGTLRVHSTVAQEAGTRANEAKDFEGPEGSRVLAEEDTRPRGFL